MRPCLLPTLVSVGLISAALCLSAAANGPLFGGRELAAGARHTCAVVVGGAVKCWGDNGNGQLGNGATVAASMPVDVVGVFGATLVATAKTPLWPESNAGGGHTCAIVSDGRVKCWGDNSSGQLGNGTTLDAHTPVDAIGVSGATAVAAGADHSCAIVSGGAVKCWGSNQYGQLGNGTLVNATTAVDVIGVSGATALGRGGLHTCAVVAGGAIKCWGSNSYGQLGNGTILNAATAVDVIGVSGATTLDAGSRHTCAIGVGGGVKCWGDNQYGQLGNGTTIGSSIAVDAKGVTGATALAAGGHFTCVIVGRGGIKCWGYNNYGQLGNGTTNYYANPSAVDVIGVSGASEVAAGAWHVCAIVGGGAINCWGGNVYGQLGNGTSAVAPIPVDVTSLTGVTAIADGYFHSCAVVTDGAVKCWGRNSYGQLGNGKKSEVTYGPVDVVGISGATAVAAGMEYTCAIVGGGAVKCWGANWEGQLGDGTTKDATTAVAVVGVAGATALAADYTHTCAIVSDGAIKCWGSNAVGQLGNGTFGSFSPTAVDVVGVSGATAVAAGSLHTCAIVAGGAIKCWGLNLFGELGNGTTSEVSSTAVDVIGVAGATTLEAGGRHTCAIGFGGGVKCWGDNEYGQLGNGTASSSSVAVDVIAVPGATAIATGAAHTCAVVAGGAIRCWGWNYHGQLGNGTIVNAATAVDVMRVKRAAALAAGAQHTCALVNGGTVTCWGDNYFGQLGDGGAGYITTPTIVVMEGQSATATQIPTLSLPAIAALISVLSLTGIYWLKGCPRFGADRRARLRF